MTQRQAIESLYKGVCTVYEKRPVKGANHATKHAPVAVLTGQPCRLSYGSKNASSGGDVAEISQNIKLFMAPEVNIKAGSKIVVTQNGITTAFEKSGQPAVYTSHQEIPLKLFDRWA